jgi:hypothetical protein
MAGVVLEPPVVVTGGGLEVSVEAAKALEGALRTSTSAQNAYRACKKELSAPPPGE